MGYPVVTLSVGDNGNVHASQQRCVHFDNNLNIIYSQACLVRFLSGGADPTDTSVYPVPLQLIGHAGPLSTVLREKVALL